MAEIADGLTTRDCYFTLQKIDNELLLMRDKESKESKENQERKTELYLARLKNTLRGYVLSVQMSLKIIRLLLTRESIMIHCNNIMRLYFKYRTLNLKDEDLITFDAFKHGGTHIYVTSADEIGHDQLFREIHILLEGANIEHYVDKRNGIIVPQYEIKIIKAGIWWEQDRAFVSHLDQFYLTPFALYGPDGFGICVQRAIGYANIKTEVDENKVIPRITESETLKQVTLGDILKYIFNGFDVECTFPHYTFYYFRRFVSGDIFCNSQECVVCYTEVANYAKLKCNPAIVVCVDCFKKHIEEPHNIDDINDITCIWCRRKTTILCKDYEHNPCVYYPE